MVYPYELKSGKVQENKRTKNQKSGVCDTIVIGKYRGSDSAFLIQNIFPTTKKYIDHIDIIRDKAVPVVEGTKQEIIRKVEKVFKLKKRRYKSYISKC